jgi:hypothetical protein
VRGVRAKRSNVPRTIRIDNNDLSGRVNVWLCCFTVTKVSRYPEPVFLNVYGAQESLLRNEHRFFQISSSGCELSAVLFDISVSIRRKGCPIGHSEPLMVFRI